MSVHRLLAAVLACGLSLGAVRLPAATTDLESVRRALGAEVAALTPPAPGVGAQLVETIARSATLRLGGGVADWKPTHPMWPGVYAHVHADLETDTPTLEADLRAAADRTVARLVSAVAAEVSPADIEAILAYYRTPQGERYQELMSRLDGILGRGLVPPPGYDAKARPEPLAEDQQRPLLEMVMLSRLMQAASAAQELVASAHGDTSGFGGVAFMMTLAPRFHQPEAIALQAKYAPDLPAFTEFEKTAAAHSLFRALGRTMFLPAQPPTRVFDEVVEKAEQRHGQEWQALYRAATGQPTPTE